jgi:2-amino-4-hydroxy-6-hydroxymethyldihydropteridine diphosphokinase
MIREPQKKIEIGTVKKQDILENQVNKAYLAIGSNLGKKTRNIDFAKYELEKHKVKILKSSSYYKSESWPDCSQPKFINIIVKIKSNFTPLELLKVCNSIELKLGRIRSQKNAPRTCDIDIIDCENIISKKNNDKLILPHPRMEKRNFVLLPLFELNKSWKHPKTKTHIVDLINSLPIKDLRSINQI